MKISHTIRTLIVSEFLYSSGFSLFGPIFAIFITGQIVGGTLEVVGFAAAITQIFKSVLQIPIARYLDRNHGEYDDFFSLTIGNALVVLVPVLYFFANTTGHIYAIGAVHGIGLALAVPPWHAIFTRHIDKMKENVEWSMVSVAVGVAGAGSAALGGILAEQIGFRSIFFIGAFIALAGMLVQMRIFADLKEHVSRGTVKPTPDRIS